MAPEYAMRGYLTDKADVYSFGVVTLELISGKSNTNYQPTEDLLDLLDWAFVLQEQGSLLELVDPSLGTNYSKEEALQMLNLALVCTNPFPKLRPSMSTVVSTLEGRTPVRVPSRKHIRGSEELQFKSFRNLPYENPKQIISTLRGNNGGASSHSSTSTTLSDYTE